MHSLQPSQNQMYVPPPTPVQNQVPQQVPFHNAPGQPQMSFLSDYDIQRITNSLNDSLMHSLKEMVNVAVTKQVEPFKNKIQKLEDQVNQMTDVMNQMKIDQDNTEQYSRRMCVLISNVPEKTGESTDNQVMEVVKKSGANISLHDIDRSHRIMRKNPDPDSTPIQRSKPRDIVVKFLSYNAKSNFMKGRKTLRQNRETMFIKLMNS